MPRENLYWNNITAVVNETAPRRPSEVCNATGLECMICFEEFKNEQHVAVFGCEGKHLIHLHCHEDLLKSPRGDNDQCPKCRGESSVMTEVIVEHFYSGKDAENAVIVD
jgi:Ring finger domain